MISFRTRNLAVASTLILLSIVMLIGAAVWYLMPLPTSTSLAARNAATKKGLNDEINKAEADRTKTENDIQKVLWSETPDKVAPKAMTKITELARKRALKLVAFRPSKFIEGQGLIEVPIGVTVDGSFPNTMAFVKDIEGSDLKLAVSTVQVASADTASDRVTGTINLVAYLRGTSAAATSGDKNAKKS